MDQKSMHILTINSGSSSLKFALYRTGETEEALYTGNIDRIGLHGSHFQIRDSNGKVVTEHHQDIPDHNHALSGLLKWLKDEASEFALDAVGHRVVHGGDTYLEPHFIDRKMMDTLSGLVPLAPDHLPHEIKAIKAIANFQPELKQAACFDTAFHRHLPQKAQMYALPRYLWNQGIRRYGFHGLSYEYIMKILREKMENTEAKGRIIIAHLGNGASMAAISGGNCIETTMGFTPSGGLVMSSRSGDMDPGALLHLIEEKGLKPSTVHDMVNQQAGLLGVSGISSSMKDLLEKEKENSQAAEAIELFCYSAKKFLAALTAALGGLDTLVFTAGIGANSPEIRGRICRNLEYLGIKLDPRSNSKNEALISSEGSRVKVRVLETNEQLMIALHTASLLKNKRHNLN